MNITLTRNMLLAASPFAGTKNVRYSPNGLLIEPAAGGSARAVAIDGNAMMAVRDEAAAMPADAAPVIIPNDAIAWMLKTKAETVNLDGDGLAWTASAGGQSLAFHAINGRFPDYRAVMPAARDEPAVVGAVDVAYLGRLHKAFKPLSHARRPVAVRLIGTGENRAVRVRIGYLPDGVHATGVIMPMRDGADESDAALA